MPSQESPLFHTIVSNLIKRPIADKIKSFVKSGKIPYQPTEEEKGIGSSYWNIDNIVEKSFILYQQHAQNSLLYRMINLLQDEETYYLDDLTE